MTNPTQTGLAIVAGQGALPGRIAERCAQLGRKYQIVRMRGQAPGGDEEPSPIIAEFERLGALFAAIRAAGCGEVVFAGAMTRPDLDPARFDAETARLAPRLIPDIGSGDDRTLRAIASIFEVAGFGVVAAHALLPELLATAGTMGQLAPTAADLADTERAAVIVAALGAADIGQGAVVAQGLCLGAETLQGTDAMLAFVGTTPRTLWPDPTGARGVLFKAPKPGQDQRMDLPAIGPATIRNAFDAGLGGVAVQAGGVLMLDRAATIDVADRLGLFVFGLSA